MKPAVSVNVGRNDGRATVLLAVALAAALPACAPVFSDLQSAKLVGKQHVEVTPSFSSVSFSDDDGSEHIQNHFGVQVAAGVHDKLDMRLRYENVQVADDGPSVSVLGFGPKIQLFKDRIAAYLPVGFAFGSDIEAGETWAIHPTLLLTAPAHRNVEINASAKYLVPLSSDDGDNLVAFNLGLGLGPNLKRWAIRPEVGFLLNPGEDGHFTHFSLGVSLRAK